MKFLVLISSNLRRKKLRTALTVLSIFVAFLLFGILCVIRNALTGGVTMAGADRLIARHKVSIIQLLPESYSARILRIPGVSAVAHQTWFGGIYQDPKNFFPNMPVDPESFLAMYPEFRLPDDQKAAWFKNRVGAIVGRTTAKRFGWKVGDRIPLNCPIWQRAGGGNTWEFEISGIYDGAEKSTETTQLFFHYDYFEEGRAFAKGEVGWYTIKIKDPAQAAQVAKAVDEEFANSPYETKTEAEGAFAQGFAQQIGDIGAIMLGIQTAVFFTILLVAANTMGQAVRERTEEIGVLKALGFTNGLVLVLILAESCLIAGIGGLAGLGITCLITAGGSPMPSLLPIFYFPTSDLSVGLGLVLALGLFTGLFPALQAMRLGVAEALRKGS